MTFKFKNGDPVHDIITGFKGIVVARADHLTGCNRYSVQPLADEDGKKLPEGYWIDEPCLMLDKTKTRIVLEDVHAGQPPG